MTIIHKPFDLEKALAGEPFGTKSGNKVIEFYFYKNKMIKYPLSVALHDSNEPLIYMKTGKFYDDYVDEDYDLVMYCEEETKEEEKQGCLVCETGLGYLDFSNNYVTVCKPCWFKIFKDAMDTQNSYLLQILHKRVQKKKGDK